MNGEPRGNPRGYRRGLGSPVSTKPLLPLWSCMGWCMATLLCLHPCSSIPASHQQAEGWVRPVLCFSVMSRKLLP